MKATKMKRKLKYLYYNMLIKVFNSKKRQAISTKLNPFEKRLMKILPGTDRVAAKFLIKGRMKDKSIRSWIRKISRNQKVDCWVYEKEKDSWLVLLVGRGTDIKILINCILSFTGELKITDNISWFNRHNVTLFGKKFSIVLAGDTSLGQNYFISTGKKALSKRLEMDSMSFFEGVKTLVTSGDYFILNLETVLADNPPVIHEKKKYLKWDNASHMLKVLKELGVTAVSLANNHVMDFGPEYMLSTKVKLKKAGIRYFGAGASKDEAAKPLIIELEGEYSTKRIYIINAMSLSKRYKEEYSFYAEKDKPGINTLKILVITKQIKRIRKKEPDATIVVFPHWCGADYKWATLTQSKVYEKIIDAGADIIIGHGPHMMQQIEKYGKGLIIYSLGNFVFNTGGQYKQKAVPPYSLISQLEFNEAENWSVECKLYPILSNNKLQNYQPRPVNKQEFKEVFLELKKNALEEKKFMDHVTYGTDKIGYFLLSADPKLNNPRIEVK